MDLLEIDEDDQDTGQEIETSKRILDSVLKKGRRKHSESTENNDTYGQEPAGEDPRFITTNKNFRKVQEEIPRNKRNHHLKDQDYFDNNDEDVNVNSSKKMVRFDPNSEEHNRKYAIASTSTSKVDIINKKKKDQENNKKEVVVEKPFYKIASDLKDRFTFSSPSPSTNSNANLDVQSTPNHFFSFSTPPESTEEGDKKVDDSDVKKIIKKDTQVVVNFFAKSFGVGESNFFFLQEDDENFGKLFQPVEEYFLENKHQAGGSNGDADNYFERKLIKKLAKGKVKNFKVKSKKNFRRWRTAQANNKNKNNKNNNNNNNKKRL